MDIYLLVLICTPLLAVLSAWMVPHVPLDAASPTIIRWSPIDPLIVLGLIAFSAARDGVGTDYGMYLRFFEMANPALDWWGQVDLLHQEAGYTFLTLMVKSVTTDPHAILWVTAALTITPIYLVLRRESRDLAFSLLLYIGLAFYVAPFNVVRQGLACAFSFWAYSFLGRRRWAYVLLSVVAVLFHSSALIVVVIQIIARRWRPTIKSTAVVLLTGLALATTVFAVPAVRDLLGTLNARYGTYAVDSQSAGLGTYLTALGFVALVAVALALRAHNERPDWLAMMVIGVALLLLGIQAVEATRMFLYFGIYATVLIPNTLAKRGKSNGLRLLIGAGAVAYFVMYLLSYSDLLPYRTYF